MLIEVGPNRLLKTPADALAKASAGDTIVLDGAVYPMPAKALEITKAITIVSKAGQRAQLNYDGTGIPGPVCVRVKGMTPGTPVTLGSVNFTTKGNGWAVMAESTNAAIRLVDCNFSGDQGIHQQGATDLTLVNPTFAQMQRYCLMADKGPTPYQNNLTIIGGTAVDSVAEHLFRMYNVGRVWVYGGEWHNEWVPTQNKQGAVFNMREGGQVTIIDAHIYGNVIGGPNETAPGEDSYKLETLALEGCRIYGHPLSLKAGLKRLFVRHCEFLGGRGGSCVAANGATWRDPSGQLCSPTTPGAVLKNEAPSGVIENTTATYAGGTAFINGAGSKGISRTNVCFNNTPVN